MITKIQSSVNAPADGGRDRSFTRQKGRRHFLLSMNRVIRNLYVPYRVKKKTRVGSQSVELQTNAVGTAYRACRAIPLSPPPPPSPSHSRVLLLGAMCAGTTRSGRIAPSRDIARSVSAGSGPNRKPIKQITDQRQTISARRPKPSAAEILT